MKIKHGLSGIYFRQKNVETGKFESVVFEDLETEEQERTNYCVLSEVQNFVD